MEKKEARKVKNIKSFENKNLKTSSNGGKSDRKSLPWWVELLFVQIGLPDKWLVKILKSKKNSSEFIKNEKKLLLSTLLFLFTLIYFYPVIKYSKSKIQCQKIAKKYISGKSNSSAFNGKQLKMLSTNFCNGGNEVYQIENIKN